MVDPVDQPEYASEEERAAVEAMLLTPTQADAEYASAQDAVQKMLTHAQDPKEMAFAIASAVNTFAEARLEDDEEWEDIIADLGSTIMGS